MIKVTVLLLASAKFQDQAMSPPPVNNIKGCSTKLAGADAAETTTPCNPTTTTPVEETGIPNEDPELRTFFGVNLDNTGVTFYEAIIIFLIISALNIPQLYVGIKLVEATDMTKCHRKSISLAFIYQRTQFVVISAELLFLGLVLYFVGNNFGPKGCHLFYTGMLGIFSKLVFIFTVAIFLDEQLKSMSKQKKVIMVTKSSAKPWTG